jgi:hypothetical protein
LFSFLFFNLVNIGQNGPNNNTQPPQSTPSQAGGTNPTQQATATPMATNVPGVAAGGLDFSNIARSIGSMVQGLTGRFVPGATLVNPNPSTHTSTTSNTASSSQTSNTATTSTNVNEADNVTEHMLTGIELSLKAE